MGTENYGPISRILDLVTISKQIANHTCSSNKNNGETLKAKRNSQEYLNIRIASTSGPTEAVLTL